MIEYTKLFNLLESRNMKKTDLLQIMSSHTLAKLGKGATVQTDIIDKICIFLDAQPNDIMEVYTYKEINGEQYKTKTRDIISHINNEISYGHKKGNHEEGLTVSELKKLVNEDGRIDLEKLDKIIEQICQ